MGAKSLILFLLVSLFVATSYCTTWRNASVKIDEVTGKFAVVDGVEGDQWIAKGSFKDEIFQNGWSFLNIETNGKFPDSYQAYAAGLVEGYLSADLIRKHWNNRIADYCIGETGYCQRLKLFLQQNLDFMNKKIELYRGHDSYWHQAALVLEQLSGLDDGYGNKTAEPSTTPDVFGMMLFNIFGDLEELETILNRTVVRHHLGYGHCSALIKLLYTSAYTKDLYVAQDSWNTFSSMLRILKKYDFAYRQTADPKSELVPGKAATFSSYPGTIFSGDDFYLLSSGLATLETTIGNGNPALWKYIKPDSVLEWVRNLVANRLAVNGEKWVHLFSAFNSGTYNNQWMIVDYNKFNPATPLQDGLLWVLEQLPGYIKSKDMTDMLRNQTYWPSYNSPYFEEVFNMSGGVDNVKQHGDWFSYDKTPRALIFKRDHVKVKDLSTMTKLMRYNDYQHDPLSRCNCTPPYSAENAISARSDLNPANGTYPFSALGHRAHGGIDMKLTSFSLFQNMQFVAIGGPTYDNVPPFQWSQADFAATEKHEGHPDVWKFDPVLVSWTKN